MLKSVKSFGQKPHSSFTPDFFLALTVVSFVFSSPSLYRKNCRRLYVSYGDGYTFATLKMREQEFYDSPWYQDNFWSHVIVNYLSYE